MLPVVPQTTHGWRSRAHARRLRRRSGSGSRPADLGPGTWLREHTVATSLGLSRTPVREALRLLAAEGVVELVHNRGARVVELERRGHRRGLPAPRADRGLRGGSRGRRADAACVAELRALQERYERALDEQDSGGRHPRSATTTSTPPCSPRRAAPGCPCWWRWCRAPRSSAGYCSPTTTTTGGAASWPTATSSPRSRTATTDLATSAMSSHILAARYSALRA